MPAQRKKPNAILETVRTVVYAVLIALVVRTVAFEPFNIPSGSMIPTLLVGDYLFVSKYSYGYSRHSLPLSLGLFDGRIFSSMPKRGDVVVFKLPADNRTDYIKRVMGLPGDRIQVTKGVVSINGNPVALRQTDDFIERDLKGSVIRTKRLVETLPEGVEHPILRSLPDDEPNENTQEYVVPPGHYFMMGDNRDNSADSRVLSSVGYVPFENLVGRAEVIFFSTDGSASLPEVWKWPWAIRWGRFFTLIN